MIWDNYCLKKTPFVFHSSTNAEVNRTSFQDFLGSEYEVKQVAFESPYLFHRFVNKKGPGSLERVMAVETMKAASLLIGDQVKEQLTNFLTEHIGDCSDIVFDFLVRSPETSCHLKVLDVLLNRVGRSMTFSFENRFFNGIGARSFVELGMLLGAGGLWIKDCPVYFGTPLYCIDGDSIQWCSDRARILNVPIEELDETLSPRHDVLHHVFSDLKEAEATISGLEHVIQARISKEIHFHWHGIQRGNANNRQWELAQTLYVMRMKEMSLKYKNVHFSKRKNVIKEAEELLLEARGLYDYYMRDHDVYILADDHYTLKKTERIHRKVTQVREIYQPPSYFVEADSEAEKQAEPVQKYHKWTINEDRFYEFCAKELEPKRLDERIPLLIESINYMKKQIGSSKPLDRDMIHERAFIRNEELRKKSPGFMNLGVWYNYDLEMERFNVYIKDFFENKLISLLDPPKKVDIPEEYSKYFNMSDVEIMSALKKEKQEKGERLSNNQAKKILSSIKAAKKEKKEQEEAVGPGQVKMIEIVPPKEIRMVEKVEEKFVTEYKPIPNRLIMSEEKHTDFVKHSYPPEPKVIIRNAKKYVINAARRDLASGKRVRDMKKNSQNNQRRMHRLAQNRYNSYCEDERKALWKKRNDCDRGFVKLYHELKDKRFREPNRLPYKEPDFNVYDFAAVNRSKQLILIGEVFWARGKYTKSKEKMLRRWEEKGYAYEKNGIPGLWNKKRERARANRKYKGLTQNIGRLLAN
jgi:hypothetical protein